ncbi:MAG: F0F1 ATP synthase subunit A [Bacteroidetes bacterium]|nr:F0F1 ATP synthase subunit A [Bacteroidota bacterium]
MAFFSNQQATEQIKQVADTLNATSHELSSKEIFTHLFDHLKDGSELEIPFGHIELPHFTPINFYGLTIDLSITKHVAFILFSSLLLIISLSIAARKNSKSKAPTGFGNLIEVLIIYIRDEIVLPNMGKSGLQYLPYLLTTFFFILVMNLFGLIPYGASSTGNISVTAGLAIIAFIMIQYSAIKSQGIKHYLAHLTGGVQVWLWPIMIPIEIIGLFTKPFALCIRLFANMTGGHLVILSLIGLIFIFKTYIVAPISVLFVVGINLLELFVAVLQAYVFTMLTALFMGFGIQAGENAHHEKESHNH